MNIVDLAYQIIDLHEENKRLRMENEGLKEYRAMYFDELDRSINHSHAIIGSLMVAALDPESVISLGHKAKADLEVKA